MKSILYPFIIAFLLIAVSISSYASTPPLTADNEWKGRLVIEIAADLNPLAVSDKSGVALTGIPKLDALARKYIVHAMEKLIPWAETPDDPTILDISRFYVLEFPPETDPDGIASAYELLGEVIRAESYVVHLPCYTPDDPLFPSQWHLQHINAETAYDYSLGNDEVIVGIVDSGIDTTHEDLRGNLWVNPGEDLNGNGTIQPFERNGIDDDLNGFIDDFWGWNTWQNTNNVFDEGGHGTGVAGCASAVTDNAIGISSLGCKAKLMSAKAGDGEFIYSAPQSIVYCVDNGANVINLSFGSPFYSAYEQSIINYAWSQGAVITAAVGSDNIGSPIYPAGYNNVMAVGGTDQNDHKAYFSNWGEWVDVYAPGVDILTTIPGNGYASWNGTSFTAPITAGLAAVIWAAAPSLTNEEVVQQILTTAVIIDSLNPGYPSPMLRIDAGAALAGLFLNVELTPDSIPVVIPPAGGQFSHDLSLSNEDTIAHSFDLWCTITLLDSTLFGPVVGPANLTLEGSSTVGRDRTQRIPAHAPRGNYLLVASLGSYPGSICSRDTIPFEKLGATDGENAMGWLVESEESGSWIQEPTNSWPTLQVTPNPFNISTSISFTLHEGGPVNLTIYDLSGRSVVTLMNGWHLAGAFDATFEASGLSSGLFIYRLVSPGLTYTGKLLLIK